MRDRVSYKLLKLFGQLYLRYLLLAVFLLVFNALFFTLIGVPFPARAKIMGLFFFLPLILTAMQIGFDIYEGELKDKL